MEVENRNSLFALYKSALRQETWESPAPIRMAENGRLLQKIAEPSKNGSVNFSAGRAYQIQTASRYTIGMLPVADMAALHCL